MFPLLERQDDDLNPLRGLWNGCVLSIGLWAILISIGYGVNALW